MWRMVSTVCFVALAISGTAFGLPPSNTPGSTVVALRLDLDGTQIGFLEDCAAFGSETEVTEVIIHQQNGQDIVRKIPGRTRLTNIACSRGLSQDTTFSDWREVVEQGNVTAARKDGSLIFFDQTLQELFRFNFTNAWPNKLMIDWDPAALGSPVTENIEFVIESLTRP